MIQPPAVETVDHDVRRTSGRPAPRPSPALGSRPPTFVAPNVSGALAEAAEKLGLDTLEAAAYKSLGVPLA